MAAEKTGVFSIYRITNTVNGKCYVGFTERRPEDRWRQHINALNSKIARDYPLMRAIRKYGLEAFSFDVLYQSRYGEHTLVEMEPHFIAQYSAYPGGYNQCRGGRGTLGRKLTPEQCAAMSEARRGKLVPDGVLRRAIESNIGRRHSPEWKAKQSEGMRRHGGRWLGCVGEKHRCAKTYRITKGDGTVLQFTGLSHFCRENGYSAACLSEVATGKRPFHRDIVKAEIIVGGKRLNAS